MDGPHKRRRVKMLPSPRLAESDALEALSVEEREHPVGLVGNKRGRVAAVSAEADWFERVGDLRFCRVGRERP